LDVMRDIPVGARLETVLEKLFPEEKSGGNDDDGQW